MASLPLLCGSTAPPCPSPNGRSSFPNPSHFLSHANRNLRLHAQNDSSSSQSADSSPAKVDRRNMLLGLGGLYGAGNLMSSPSALAEPAQAPDLSKCGVATDVVTKDTIDVNCCLTTEERIIDYKLPPVFQVKMRPSAHRVSPEYIYKYNMAIDRMRRLPADDPRSFMQQANIHCAYCNTVYKQAGTDVDLQVHNSWLFFPFHRWYLYFYERILGKLINDPTFALPFWNWDNPKGMTVPPMFMDPRSAIYDSKRNPRVQESPPAIVNLAMGNNITDPLQLVTNNLTIMHTEMVRCNADVFGFMGNNIADTKDGPGPGSVERGSHTAVHVWTGDPRQPRGEDLGNFYSAGRDPLFYCHHGNVDRMWTIWQYFLPNTTYDKRITDPDFLNSSFLFYDENAQLVRVYVKDALDNLRMGFEYERIDLPWLDYRPPRQSTRARSNRKSMMPAPAASTLFPLKLEQMVRFQVNKTKKGKADESLVLVDITVDTSKFLKVDVFVNDEDDNAEELDKASYVGTYAQVPHNAKDHFTTTSIKLNLKEVYNDMDMEDDDTVVVTLVPRHQGPGVTIGGIKIVENPPPKA